MELNISIVHYVFASSRWRYREVDAIQIVLSIWYPAVMM